MGNDHLAGLILRRGSPYARLVMPLTLILVIALIALEMPKPLHFGPMLVVAPALTATTSGPGLTAVVAALAVAVQVLLRVVRGDLSPGQSAIQVAALLVVSVFVVLFAAARERRRRELEQVRSVSEAAQRVLLRPLPPRVGPLRIASTYLASAAEATIGGDLYAAARVPGGTRLLIGDVRGKGLTSVGDAALLLCAFREAAYEHATLPRLMARLEASVGRNLAELAQTDENAREYFITAAVLHIPDDRPQVELISCGHPPPLRLHGPEVTALEPQWSAPPLGLGELGEGYRMEPFRFDPGDLILLYTDGVPETRDGLGRFYPLGERIRSWPRESPETFVRHGRTDLLAYAGGRLDDDAAMIVVRRESG